MIQNFTVLALIPARGGSKRIPRKNIVPLGGKPLIAYTVEQAKHSKYIDRIVVSTEDEEIARIARESGAEVPFMRPHELAADDTPDLPVFAHMLEWFEGHEGYRPDIIVQLRPNAPFRPVSAIDAAIEMIAGNPEADSVRSVRKPEQSPYKMYSINEKGFLAPVIEMEGVADAFNLPGQALPPTYRHIGYVDVMRRETILTKHSMSGAKILPLILEKYMPHVYPSLNEPEELAFSEYLIEKKLA